MIRRCVTIAVLALGAGCAEREVLLEGERLDLRGNPVPSEIASRAAPLTLPPAVANANWDHAGGNTRHQLSHVALGQSLSVAWSQPIGSGNEKRRRLNADPVVADGRVFALDSRSQLSAVSTAGAPLWSVDLSPAADAADESTGTGLAVVGGRVYATSGFGLLSVLDASTGDLLWSQDFDAAIIAPPTISGENVYVVTANAIGWALSRETGRIQWQVFGATAERAAASGASPLIAGPLVVFPFPSGQMISAVASTGQTAWSASVSGQRLGAVSATVRTLSGAPIFDGTTIYAGAQSGRVAAFDGTSGSKLWDAKEGASGPLWLAGGALFFVSDRNQLVRLDAATGETVWVQDLPFFTRTRIKRRKSIFVHNGPIVAGGRLMLASDDGVLRQFNPASGELLGTMALPDGAASNPIVAGRTLYFIGENGTLYALR